MNFEDVRLPWFLPAYPPYHQGPYIEEYFYEYYLANKELFDNYLLIPIFWTTAYLKELDVSAYIHCLPSGRNFFCVAQHDDAVKEKLPKGTIVFSAGGNNGGIPIPLVCSRTPQIIQDRDIFCSFVGSISDPARGLRQKMVNTLKSNIFNINIKRWTTVFKTEDIDEFLYTTARSKFTLCPRGYGAQSFRFYEALQLGSVPIYIHDDTIWKPYSDFLNWDDFSISVHINQIQNLEYILCSITEEKRTNMAAKGMKAYNEFFAMENLPRLILRHLSQLPPPQGRGLAQLN